MDEPQNKQYITDFTYGLDLLTDPRLLPPNSPKETKAGTPFCQNVDIGTTGAIMTSNGYEVVSRVDSSDPIKSLIDYEKDDTNRYLVISHADKHYAITPSNTTWDDTNLGDYGTEADFVDGTIYKGAAVQATATCQITSYANLISGTPDTVVVNGVIFTAQSGAATPGDNTFQASVDEATTAESLKVQVNAHASPNLTDITATRTSETVTFTADTAGEGGNSYKLAYNDNDGNIGAVVSGANFTGGRDDRKLIIGNSSAANFIKKADFVNAMADIGGAPSEGYIMAVFMGRLFIARGKTLYYTAAEDEEDWSGGGTVGFNDIVTGLHVEGNRMIVFTKSYHQGIFFQYDSTNVLSSPLKEPYERKYGNLASKCLIPIYSNIAYWSKFGFLELGAEEGIDELGLPRPKLLSKRIDPALKNANYNVAENACAIFNPYEQQSYFSIPYDGAQYNSKTFVYNWNFNAWTTRTGIYPTDYEFFRESDKTRDEVYFTDHFDSRLLKFNDGYSYAGGDYLRKWVSKIFDHGQPLRMKRWHYIKITGSIYATTTFTIKITVDGNSESYDINSTALVKDQFDNYLGDDWVGDNWLGGKMADNRFKKFKDKFEFPSTIREGFEMQIEIYNSKAEQPWKVDSIEIGYDYLSNKIPNKYINNAKKP